MQMEKLTNDHANQVLNEHTANIQTSTHTYAQLPNNEQTKKPAKNVQHFLVELRWTVADRHALLATASGELLSLILDLRFKDKADPASPEIKHASVSKIANALTACFGPTFSLQKPPAAPWSNSCNTRGSNCGSAALGTSAAEKIITAVDCLVGQRQATGPPAGDNRIRFALCLSGGYCSVGAYSQVAPENKWMLCSKSWQVFPPASSASLYPILNPEIRTPTTIIDMRAVQATV